MENFTDADYTHVKWVCKAFEIKNRGKYVYSKWYIIVSWFI